MCLQVPLPRAGLLKGLEVLYTGRVAIPEVDGPLVKEVAQALGIPTALLDDSFFLKLRAPSRMALG